MVPGGELLDMPKLSVVDGYAQASSAKTTYTYTSGTAQDGLGLKFGIQRMTM